MKLRRTLSRRAVALLVTLWVVVLLSIMAYSAMFEANLNIDLTRLDRDRFYARMMARAGIGRAMLDLRNDLRYDRARSATEPAFDAKGDAWAKIDETYTDVPMTSGKFTVRVTDEDSLLSLERPAPTAVSALLEVLGMEDEEERDQTTSAILDYIDQDDVPRFANATSAKENDAYAELIVDANRLRRDADVSYRSKNDRILVPDELLDVFGVTPALYFGEASGQEDKRLNFRPPRYYRRQREDAGDLRPGLRDLVSTFSRSRLNVNTARPEVLQALFSLGGADMKAAEEAANEVVTRRPEPTTGRRVDNDKAFRSGAELSEMGVSAQALSFISATLSIQVTSNTFRIVSTGECRGVKHTITAIVRREWDSYVRDDTRGLDGEPQGIGPKRGSDTGTKRRDEEGANFEHPALRVLSWRED